MIGINIRWLKMTPLSRRIIHKFSRKFANLSPLRVNRRVFKRNAIGFFYHVVSDKLLPHIRHLYPYKSTKEFEQDLIYLKKHFRLVSYQELVYHFLGEKRLPSNAAYISFDDGFAECYTEVSPLLQKHAVPCIFFLTTDFIDNHHLFYRNKVSLCIEKIRQLDFKNYESVVQKISRALQINLPSTSFFLDWFKSRQQTDEFLIDQVCEILEVDVAAFLQTQKPYLTKEQILALQKDGFTIGAHTQRHQKLTFLKQEEQTVEIIESCRFIHYLTGAIQVPFAFPFSGRDIDRDFLANLRVEYPFMGLIFDTQKLRKDSAFVFNRIWADKPVPGITPEKNLAFWLHQAYQQSWTERVME